MPGELLQASTPPFLPADGKGKQSPTKAAPPAMASTLYLISENDIIYENDILRNPESIRPWLDYVRFKRQHGSLLEQAFVLERACNALPRSYKLWKMYLELRIKHLKGKNAARRKQEYTKVNRLFERALVLLNKMPRIWEMYLSFLCQQPLVTRTRRAFDQALRALPITQHHRIWTLYLPFANSAGGETVVKIWRRYLQIYPDNAEEFIGILVEQKLYTEAIKRYMDILNNPRFKSKEAKGPFEIWTEMLELIIDHAREVDTELVSGIDVDAVVRSGVARFPDQR
ncbi:pre-mRNA-splicing factor syf1, partial [Elasticomyces elasticus]